MEQLTVKDLELMIYKLKLKYPKTYKDIRVFLGDDDELNGVHHGWYADFFTKAESKNDDGIFEMLQEQGSHYDFKQNKTIECTDEVMILIS